jgi:hypothetical protein
MPSQVFTSVEKGTRRDYHRQWYLGRKELYKESHLKKTYGLTVDDLLSLMESQSNLCKICKIDLTTLNPKNVHIDHCHNSNEMKIRGVLCNKCNMALGLMNDDVTLLQNCIEYLNAVPSIHID